MNKVLLSYTLLTFTLLLGSCDKLEFSPNQKFDNNTPIALNAKNLTKLKNKTVVDDTVRFILTGDTQRSYDQARALVNLANNYKKLDFVFLNGDISDFGLLQEMEWVNNIYDDLNVPYITVIGNHDLVANGFGVYTRMFGELNFSFIYKKVKFICHDSNSREYKFDGTVPNIGWLNKELQTDASVEGIVGVSHIPPRSQDFDANLKEPYENLFNSFPKFLVSLHSHENTNDIYRPYPTSVPFIISNAVTNRQCLYVEIANGILLKNEIVKY